MQEGTVKWFNARKGYGFIATAEGKDIFVHYASIKSDGYKTLNEGDAVTFEITEGEKGLRAENVSHAGVSASTPEVVVESDEVESEEVESDEAESEEVESDEAESEEVESEEAEAALEE